ncbi:tetratricopeptide repeat protein [Planktothrix tepida]|uniref:tetratricopeptide repeat protein n=1 Tax=Planktothrix tepida TaxID=1678309 RepID=UPI0009328DD7|nr:tetratricopeptide repeat protein [Planktothrix tepida]
MKPKPLKATNLFLPLGTQLQQANFSVGKVLGQGNFTITYMGSDNLLRRPVVIKEFFPQGCDRHILTVQPSNSITSANYQSAKSKFLDEACVISQIQHSGIVKIYTYFEENNTGYIVTEFLRGKTLLKLVAERGFLLEKEALGYIQQVGKALAVAHQANLLHLDISPENIILTDDGRVVLIEFGAAKEYATQLMRTYSVMLLTSEYAALEQYAPYAKRGYYTDIYALSATLYYLLTGKVPISAIERAKGVELIPPHRLNPDVNRGVSDAVMQGMGILVEGHFKSVRDFLNALKEVKPDSSTPTIIVKTEPSNQNAKSEKDKAYQLLKQGEKKFQSSQFEAALQSWEQALTIYRSIQQREKEAVTINAVGIAYHALGNHSKAIQYMQESLAIARETNNLREAAMALYNLSVVYRDIRDYAKAINHSQQGWVIARKINYHQLEAQSLGNLGIIYYFQGDYTQAIEHYLQLLILARNLKECQWEAAVLSGLGITYNSIGDYAKGIEYHYQALVLARERRDRLGEGSALGNLGISYHCISDYTKAIEYQEQSLKIAKEIDDHQVEGNSLGNLASVYSELGDYTRAIDFYEQQLAIARSTQDYRAAEEALGNLGKTHFVLGNYTKANEYAQQAMAVALQIQDYRGVATALNNLGGIAFYEQGGAVKAIEFFHQALIIAQKLPDRRAEQGALGNIGSAYFTLSNYTAAIDYQQQSLAIAQEIQDHEGVAASLASLGVTYSALGDYAKAIDYCQQALKITQEIQHSPRLGEALHNLGTIQFFYGNLEAAARKLREGIQVWEFLRAGLGSNDTYKVSLFERQSNTYGTLQQVLIAQNQPNAALEIAERSRARAFVELLARRLSPHPATQISISPPTIEQIQEIAKVQNATLVEYSIVDVDKLFIWVIKPTGEIAFRQIEIKPLSQQQKQAQGTSTLALENLVFKARKSIGVDEGGRDLGAISKVEAPVTNKSVYPELQQLHEILIKPIAESLPTDPNAHVIFIPQGSLFLVPFPALQNPHTNQFLVEQHTIVTSPSIQVLSLTHQPINLIQKLPLKAEDILVVGNPIMPTVPFSSSPLKPLAGAEGEAKAIASLLKTQPITGAAATKVDIVQKMSKSKLIHLATHGLLDDIKQLGVPGAIALAPSEGDNGFLTTGEILELKLNAFLIVLSCCHTGQGKITGDGVIGLSRSFMTAGVPNLIVSLWSINDRSSALLMIKFYEIFLQKGTSVAIALSQAQRWLLNATTDELLKSMITHFCLDVTHLTPTQKADLEEGLEKWRSPYYWAAFSTIGQGAMA